MSLTWNAKELLENFQLSVEHQIFDDEVNHFMQDQIFCDDLYNALLRGLELNEHKSTEQFLWHWFEAQKMQGKNKSAMEQLWSVLSLHLHSSNSQFVEEESFLGSESKGFLEESNIGSQGFELNEALGILSFSRDLDATLPSSSFLSVLEASYDSLSACSSPVAKALAPDKSFSHLPQMSSSCEGGLSVEVTASFAPEPASDLDATLQCSSNQGHFFKDDVPSFDHFQFSFEEESADSSFGASAEEEHLTTVPNSSISLECIPAVFEEWSKSLDRLPTAGPKNLLFEDGGNEINTPDLRCEDRVSSALSKHLSPTRKNSRKKRKGSFDTPGTALQKDSPSDDLIMSENSAVRRVYHSSSIFEQAASSLSLVDIGSRSLEIQFEPSEKGQSLDDLCMHLMAEPQSSRDSLSRPQSSRDSFSQPQSSRDSLSQPQSSRDSLSQPSLFKPRSLPFGFEHSQSRDLPLDEQNKTNSKLKCSQKPSKRDAHEAKPWKRRAPAPLRSLRRRKVSQSRSLPHVRVSRSGLQASSGTAYPSSQASLEAISPSSFMSMEQLDSLEGLGSIPELDNIHVCTGIQDEISVESGFSEDKLVTDALSSFSQNLSAVEQEPKESFNRAKKEKKKSEPKERDVSSFDALLAKAIHNQIHPKKKERAAKKKSVFFKQKSEKKKPKVVHSKTLKNSTSKKVLQNKTKQTKRKAQKLNIKKRNEEGSSSLLYILFGVIVLSAGLYFFLG